MLHHGFIGAGGGVVEPIIPDIMVSQTSGRSMSDDYTMPTNGSSVMMRSLSSKNTGRYYAELSVTGSTSPKTPVGIINSAAIQRVGNMVGVFGLDGGASGMSWYDNDGYYNGSRASNIFSYPIINSVIGFFIDVDTRKQWGWLNGTGWVENTKVFAAGGDLYLSMGSYNIGPAILHANIGQEPFAYPYGPPPSDVVLGWPA